MVLLIARGEVIKTMELLLLEIERLRQMLFIAAKDINELDGSNINDYLHDLSTRCYYEQRKEIT